MIRAGDRFATPRTPRVPTASVAASIDRIRAQLKLEFSYALYRYVSLKTGIHPTTILRYHLCRIATAPRALAVFLRLLEDEVARGREPPLEGRLRRPRPVPKKARERVSNAKVRRLLLGLMGRLRVPPNMLYRHVGTAVGLHPVTVFRHAGGRLATAPLRLFEHLSALARAVECGREVVFTRAKLGTRVVPREFVVQELRRLLSMGLFPSKRALLRFVAAGIGMPPRSLERAYSSREQILLPEEVLRFIRAFIARLEYAPEARYEVGDRVFHPDFGCCVVVCKEPRDKLVVELVDGTRRVLREGLIEPRHLHPDGQLYPSRSA